MRVLYIDRVFLLNALLDYLLCLAAARVCGLVLRRKRYALAGLLGGAYAAAALLPGLGFLAGGAGRLAAAGLLALAAFGGERRPLRCAGVFWGVSALFGGAIGAFSLAQGGASPPLRVLLSAFLLCYGALRLLFERRVSLAELPRAEIRLRLAGRESRFFALRDSGNTLCDPLTGCAVMLASPRALQPLIPDAETLFAGDGVEALARLSGREELRGRFRLIPYAAVGARGLLPLFRPEGLSVDGRDERGILVAVSPSAAGEGFEGIV